MSVNSMVMAAAGVVTTVGSGWIAKLDTASLIDVGRGIAVDVNGNVYVTGQANTTTAAYVFIAKYDTTGVIQWKRSLDTASQPDVGYGIAVDGSGNVYVTGQASQTTEAYVFIAKLMADGSILPGTSVLTYTADTMVDSAGTLVDSDRTIASQYWIATLDVGLQADIGYDIAVDGTGNVYVTGQANSTTTTS